MKINNYSQLVQAIKPISKIERDKQREAHQIVLMKYDKGSKRK